MAPRMLITPVPYRPPTSLAHNTPWLVVVEAFLAGAVDADSTRRAYRRHIVGALTFLGVVAVADLNGAMLASYRAALLAQPLAPASQGQALAAVRSFLTWSRTMGAHSLAAEVLLAALRSPRATVRRPYTVLSEPEVAGILQAATTPRDRALLAVMLGGGLRVAEVAALDVPDVLVDHEGGTALYVRLGKGRRDRIVPVQPEVAELLRGYLVATGRVLGGPGALFFAHDRALPTRAPGRLTTRSIGDVVRTCARAAGVTAKHVSPHSLRHTMAIRALRAGGNIVAVSKLLGHACIATTQRYLDHLELGELRAAVPPLPIARG